MELNNEKLCVLDNIWYTLMEVKMSFNIGSKKAESAKTAAFSKEQLLASKRYSGQRDLVNTLLADDKMYSFEEVDSMINKFMKGKVK